MLWCGIVAGEGQQIGPATAPGSGLQQCERGVLVLAVGQLYMYTRYIALTIHVVCQSQSLEPLRTRQFNRVNYSANVTTIPKGVKSTRET